MYSRRTFVKSSLASAALVATGATTSASCGSPGTKRSTTTDPGAGPQPGAPKRLLILGGTAYLGPELVAAAQARGHTITLFNRGKTNPQLFPELEKLHGDRDGQLEALAGRTWDAVIDTSGYVPRHVKLSAELLAPSVKQYVFISTISVYANLDTAGMDETAPVGKLADETVEDRGAGNYGPLKALCEQAAERAMPGRTTAIRPGLIVGPNDPTDRFTYWPARVDRGGEVLAPGDGNDPIQFIDVRDLAEWTIGTVERGTVGTYNAVGPETATVMKDLLAACRTASGGQSSVTWVDWPFLEAQQVAPWSDLPVWVPQIDGYRGFASISTARARAAGLRFRTIDDTVATTLAWWREQPDERRATLKAGLGPEREAALLTAWKDRPR